MTDEQPTPPPLDLDLVRMERFWVYRAPHGLPVADAMLAARVVGPSDVAALLAEMRRLRAEVERLHTVVATSIYPEDVDRLRDDLAAARAALTELVWVTNILGVEICDYCGVPRSEPEGKRPCSCETLRAALGDRP